MRRFFLFIAASLCFGTLAAKPKQVVETDREYWAQSAYRMALPVLRNLSEGTLHLNMPIEQLGHAGREKYTHLEAVGRLLAGIAPWLELPADNTPEGIKRQELLDLATKGIANGVDPSSSDYLNFRSAGQSLVDAAFLAEAFLRAPKNLWGGLDSLTQSRVITEMKATRATRPNYSNWLMFSAMIEAFLCEFAGECDWMRTDYAFRQMDAWYVGDGQYSDGPWYHNDYYNSFVIQPMLVDAGAVMNRRRNTDAPYSDKKYAQIRVRAARYAEVLERSISPEGTFPVVGRSILYRTGCMQSLAQAALLKMLPEEISEGQVRAALTLVMRRQLGFEGTYDANGWLTMGFCGDKQEQSGETYLSTGSMYLASTIFLPLGLPADDSFWTSAPQEWTSKKAWSGQPFPGDHAISE